jgi:hypothetical protein
MRITKRITAVCLSLFLISGLYAESPQNLNPREALSLISRLGAKRPFLRDSPDVYLEPGSLNQFFTMPIYGRLEGNGYFGYRYDEGFMFIGNEVQLVVFKDITEGKSCLSAYRLAIENALSAANISINPKAVCQIGICIVGVEEQESEKTLPGIMIESYLRNASIKKSFFIRYGAGSARGLPAAIRLSAEMLVAELQGRRILHDKQPEAQGPIESHRSNNLKNK